LKLDEFEKVEQELLDLQDKNLENFESTGNSLHIDQDLIKQTKKTKKVLQENLSLKTQL
jgi:hypothetical protein